jgi:polysaccharide deacetylase family protein (PEP-CTERM system associated)
MSSVANEVPDKVLLGQKPADNRRGITNALTVDVEDYYQVSGFEHCVSRRDWHRFESRVVASTERILEILRERRVTGTFFILGWVANRHPELVRRIDEDGHEIGCHSHWHRLVYEQTPAEFRDDLCRAREVLEDVINRKVVAYRAPSFSITQASQWALDILIEEGFTLDSSIYPVYHDRYGIPGAPRTPHQIVREMGAIAEFPPAVWECLGYPVPVGGGGYLRLYPYLLTRHALRKINARGVPFSAYLHPWELDPAQPRIAASPWLTARHYVNLHRTEERLRRLLRDFHFGTMSEALRKWSLSSARR